MLRNTSSSRFTATKNPASRRRASISDLTEDTLPIALARIRIPKRILPVHQPDGPERVHPSRRSATHQPEFPLPARWLLLRVDRDRSPETATNGVLAISLRRNHPACMACSIDALPSGLGRRSSSRLTAPGIHTSPN